jgi:hypothetical protein
MARLMKAEIERLRGLLREAHEKNVSVGWFQRVREALGHD